MKIVKYTSLAITALVAVALVSANTTGQQVDSLVGKQLGKISMNATDGKKITNADFKGKVVLIDFWATWCGPCVKASPTMEKLHKEFKDKGLVVIGANTFEDDSTGKPAAEYAKEHKYSYRMTYGNDDLAKKWGIQGIPTFVIVDSKGIVSKTFTGFGPSTEKEMRETILKLINR